MIRAAALLALVILSACTLTEVPQNPTYRPIENPEDAIPSPIRLSSLSVRIPRGQTPASISPRFFTCDGPYGYLSLSEVKSLMDKPEMKETFDETMESLGYDVTGQASLVLEEEMEDDAARTVYSVAARIVDIKMDLCTKEGVSNLTGFLWGATRPVSNGEASMTVEWTVTDRLNRKRAFKTVTSGYTKRKMAVPDGAGLILSDAFAAAAHNLGAEKNFHDLVFFGNKPPQVMPGKKRKPDRPLLFDPAEEVAIEAHPLSTTPVSPTLDRARRVAVVVRTAFGHGSGFFLTRQGHILTNAHVVGDADRVMVLTAGRKQKIHAEVLRKDLRRDVALLRLETTLPDLELRPIRAEIPKVGEALYAVGAPFHERQLQDTVTKGIMSAWRPRDPNDGQPYLQSDVYITGGNSGGPVMDANGNIIGLSVAGYADGEIEKSGLNLLIPIGDALQKLDIGY